MKLLIASNNAHKIREIKEILGDLFDEILSLREAGVSADPEETGETFEENARIKAEAILQLTGCAALADDSGLEVDALGGAPGVHSARYTGNHDDSDLDRRKFLMKNLEGEEHRTARFVSAICCVFPNGDVLRARGTCEGRIATYMKGENGFGYDAMFIADGEDRTMAEMTHEEKNEISHRGRALREFARVLKEYCNADK